MREYNHMPLTINGQSIPYSVQNARDYLVHCHGFTQEEFESFSEHNFECFQLITQIIALKQACFLLRHTTHSCESLPDSLLELKKQLIVKLKVTYGFVFDEAWMESGTKTPSVRYITLSDGSGMGDTLYVFKTNAPIEELENLERISNDILANGGERDEIPIWSNLLKDNGYEFSYVDEHMHVTAYGTSSTWIKNKYSQITEHYSID